MATITNRSPAHASIALTKRTLPYGHLLQKRQKGPESPPVVNRKRRRTPDINDAPVSSSDEDSNSANDVKIDNNIDEFSSAGWRQPLEHTTTRQEKPNNDVAPKTSAAFREPPSQREGSTQRRSTRGQVARSSPKRPRDAIEPSNNDNILDEFGQMRSSLGQSRPKKMRVYGPTLVNIHGSGSAGRAQISAKGSNATAKTKSGATDGFRIPDLDGMEKKLNRAEPGIPGASFKNVTVKDIASSRPLRSSGRSAQTRQRVSHNSDVDGFKQPKAPVARLDDDSSRFIEPVVHSGDDDVSKSMRDATEVLLGKKADSFKMPIAARCPTSSATASTTLSSLDEAGQSPSSSLSSPPGSPTLDASQEHRNFLACDVPDYYARVAARCPMCKEEVDREFLETFDCGKRMNVRTQTRFCRAHKQKTARSKWRQRRYPDIDWSGFSDRLKRYRPNIKKILDGEVSSYYRNVLEDAVKGGRNRTLHQSLMSIGFHGLTPGYYGSRGARLMMDDIMSNFSSQIRHLAATDKIISSGGVSGYVQAVLVPELAVLLVKEDMGVDDEEARAILQESIEIGDLLNEEEEEVINGTVAGVDSDDDD